ncbi:hypothetical protein HYPSUDRAFT_55159 [Hypholoma sublateritium FD-334 SS-4]|uniref:Uncharacterized protein n=1 Tax=Hypholoma sublateritium (strain FD-334 SS-4) TaxID=945553 RepID=A0A0D2NZZ2_HYPSF|nr:hypothetical protein HYPSUDRAFT_55159 [Hypholoma sublateritium FD-334 SS-4]
MGLRRAVGRLPAVVSPTISPSATLSLTSEAPAAPTTGASHKPSKGALAGGVCGGVLLLALLAFFLLRRRRRRRAERPQIPPELAPAPFTRMPSENGLHPADRPAAVGVRADPPQANGVQHKTWRGKFARRAAFQRPWAPTSSQSTNEKRTARRVPPREENAAEASVLPQESSREALLAQEVIALRMRIRVMEGLNGEGPGSRRASASVSDAPPDYEDAGIPL